MERRAQARADSERAEYERKVECGEQRAHRLAGHRIDQVGPDGGKWLEDKASSSETRVRQFQFGLGHHQVPDQDQVEVERAGRAGIWPRPATRLLDHLEFTEQYRRVGATPANRGAIQAVGLRNIPGADKGGLDERRDAQITEQRLQSGDGVCEMRSAVPQVAAERDGGQARCFSLQLMQTRVHGIASRRAEAIGSPQSRQMP